MSHFGHRGRVLRSEIDSPSYDANYFDPRGTRDLWFPVTAPYLKLAAVEDQTGGVTLFALNPPSDAADAADRGDDSGFPGKAIRAARHAASRRFERDEFKSHSGHCPAGGSGGCHHRR